MHVMSPVQQASLEYRKAYFQQIEILHYIDFVRKKYDLNTVVYYFTLALHPTHIPLIRMWYIILLKLQIFL